MINVACQCGKTFDVDDKHAGRTGRCKACGSTLAIPDISPPVDLAAPVALAVDDPPASDDALASMLPADVNPGAFAVDPPSAPLPPPVASLCGLVLPLEVRLVSPQSVTPDPWYFAAIEGLSRFLMGLGLLVACVGMLIGFLGAAGQGTQAATNYSMFVMAQSAILGIVVTLMTSLMLLAVDAARNIRAIRDRVVV